MKKPLFTSARDKNRRDLQRRKTDEIRSHIGSHGKRLTVEVLKPSFFFFKT
jgi:hypothetical protein